MRWASTEASPWLKDVCSMSLSQRVNVHTRPHRFPTQLSKEHRFSFDSVRLVFLKAQPNLWECRELVSQLKGMHPSSFRTPGRASAGRIGGIL